MTFTLTIQAEDYPFVIEAIRLRAKLLSDSMQSQIENQIAINQAPVKNEDTPWGIKKDGAPKKRPGRPKK